MFILRGFVRKKIRRAIHSYYFFRSDGESPRILINLRTRCNFARLRLSQGRLVTQVPNEDPERIKRVLDAKYRVSPFSSPRHRPSGLTRRVHVLTDNRDRQGRVGRASRRKKTEGGGRARARRVGFAVLHARFVSLMHSHAGNSLSCRATTPTSFSCSSRRLIASARL